MRRSVFLSFLNSKEKDDEDKEEKSWKRRNSPPRRREEEKNWRRNEESSPPRRREKPRKESLRGRREVISWRKSEEEKPRKETREKIEEQRESERDFWRKEEREERNTLFGPRNSNRHEYKDRNQDSLRTSNPFELSQDELQEEPANETQENELQENQIQENQIQENRIVFGEWTFQLADVDEEQLFSKPGVDVSNHLKNKITPAYECSVCYELLLDAMVLDCGHSICNGCVEKLTENICPQCKGNFTTPKKKFCTSYHYRGIGNLLSTSMWRRDNYHTTF